MILSFETSNLKWTAVLRGSTRFGPTPATASPRPSVLIDFYSLAPRALPSCRSCQQQESSSCQPYEPGEWCASTTKCEAPANPCGGSNYYCTGDGLRREVTRGWYSTPEEAAATKRTGELRCPEGYKCIGGVKQQCEQGTFSASPNATACSRARGGYEPNSGRTGEIPCAPGKYREYNGVQDQCDICPSGEYSSVEGSAECTKVDPGFQVFSNRTGQHPCGVGTYGNGGDCFPCDTGRYANVPNSSHCKPASRGSYVDDSDKSRQRPCAAGKFASTTEQAECQECNAGTFSRRNAIECTDARAGFYVDQAGLTAETECAAGTYTDAEGETSCAQCGLCMNCRHRSGRGMAGGGENDALFLPAR